MMKIKIMKKISLLVLVIFFLIFNLLFTNGVHSNIKINAETLSSDSSEFYSNIEQFKYSVNEQFILNFVLESNEDI